jgi:hypothetical protein
MLTKEKRYTIDFVSFSLCELKSLLDTSIRELQELEDEETDIRIRIKIRDRADSVLVADTTDMLDDYDVRQGISHIEYWGHTYRLEKGSIRLDLAVPGHSDSTGYLRIEGEDLTWVEGTFSRMRDFFENRKVTGRRIIHNEPSSSALIYLVAAMITFLLVRLELLGLSSSWLPVNVPTDPDKRYAFILMLVLVSAIVSIFPTVSLFGRLWQLFPRIEIPEVNEDMVRRRVVVSTILLGVVVAFIWSLITAISRLLF